MAEGKSSGLSVGVFLPKPGLTFVSTIPRIVEIVLRGVALVSSYFENYILGSRAVRISGLTNIRAAPPQSPFPCPCPWRCRSFRPLIFASPFDAYSVPATPHSCNYGVLQCWASSLCGECGDVGSCVCVCSVVL